MLSDMRVAVTVFIYLSGHRFLLGLFAAGGDGYAAGVEEGGMKEVDMDGVEVVQSGDTWTYPFPPCSRTMIPRLERNESLVTWVQVPSFCPFVCVLENAGVLTRSL